MRRRVLRASLLASGLEVGSEIASAEQLLHLIGARLRSVDESAPAVAVAIAEEMSEQAQFMLPALRAGIPVLIWPLGTALKPLEGAAAERDARSPRQATARLTSRERQVLALVAAGVANKGIARALGVSPNTVKFHLSALFNKLGVGTRAEAIAAAARAGEIAL